MYLNEKIFFSAQRNGFYYSSLKNEYIQSDNAWPDDLIEITDEHYRNLLKGQENGKVICSSDKGYPILSEMPPLSTELSIVKARRKSDELMEFASRKIAPLQDALELDLITQEEKCILHQWKKYRVALSRIDYSEPAAIIWPDTP